MAPCVILSSFRALPQPAVPLRAAGHNNQRRHQHLGHLGAAAAAHAHHHPSCCRAFRGATLAPRSVSIETSAGVVVAEQDAEEEEELVPELAPPPPLPQDAAAAAAAPSGSTPAPPPPLVVQDDLPALLHLLPSDLGAALLGHPRRAALVEVVLDLGRRPEARFLQAGGGGGAPSEYLREQPVTREELAAAAAAVGGEFGGDNRAGVPGTLHRVSALRSRKGAVVGLTCRVGRAVSGHVAPMVKDLLASGLSVLFLGRPGVGKTTAIREIARTLSDDLGRRVVIVDTSNEIGGDGDVPHPAIGGARRMQVADATRQHQVMIEAVENHMPEVVIVDEIGTEAEALACRTIAERGVVLIGTAHGCFLENLIKNPTLSDLVGGVSSVTLGDEEARSRGTRKSVLERTGPPTFPAVIEMRDRGAWVAHDTAASVDALLASRMPRVQLRLRGDAAAGAGGGGGNGEGEEVGEPTCLEVAYDQVEAQIVAQQLAAAAASSSSSASASPAGSLDGSGDGNGGAAAAAAAAAAALAVAASNTASIDELLGALLGPSRAGSPAASLDGASLDGGAELDPTAWLERFKGLTEAEALQELEVLRYLGGQSGMLRPPTGTRGSSSFLARSAAGASAAGGGGGGGGGSGGSGGSSSSKKKAKRLLKAGAKRG